MPHLTVSFEPTAITTVLITLTDRVTVAEAELRKVHARHASYLANGGSSRAANERYRGERRTARAVLDEARFALRAVVDALDL